MALRRIISKYNVISIWILLSCIFLVIVSGRSFKRRRQQKEPEFIRGGKQNITVHRGETVVLECAIRNVGPKTVVWRKVSEDFPLSVGGSMYAQKEEMSIDYKEGPKRRKTRWDLIIKKVEPRHSGTYECQIVTMQPKTYHIYLTVLNSSSPRNPGKTGKQSSIYTPRKWKTKGDIVLTGTQYINAMQRINLTCNATGPKWAPTMIDWFHKGHVIHTQHHPWRDRAVITTRTPEVPGRSLISELIIEPSLPSDAGIYVCRSSNLDTTSLMVHILNTNKTVIKRRKGVGESDPVEIVDPNVAVIPNYSFLVVTLSVLLSILR